MKQTSTTNRLFLITHEFYPKRGGIATFAEEMAKALTTQGWDVEVWAQWAAQQAERTFPFRLRRLPIRGSHDLECQLRVAVQLIRDRRLLRYATVYLPEPGPMLALMLLQQFHAFRPKRVVLTFHGSEILRFHRNRLLRPMARRLIRDSHRISVLSTYSQDLLLRHFPEATGKVVLTPGALREGFAVADELFDRPAGSGKTVVLTVGRIHPRKGQLATLEALRQLPPAVRQTIEYWVAGTRVRAGYAQRLHALAESCDFPVRFFDNLNDEELDRLYDRADIFAMTSVDHGSSVEGFGLVYLEAAAHGLPVVAHSIGGVSEAVVDGETGLLVPPDQPAQLTVAFERLIRDGALRRRLGAAGRRWARRNDWAQSARLLFTS